MSLFKKKNKDISESVEKEVSQKVLEENPDAIEKTDDVAKSVSSSSKIDDHIPMDDHKQAPSLTYKEQKSLKKSDYAAKKDKFPKTFLIKNKKNGRMAEINGFSAFQACGNIGWRPRHCIVIETKDNAGNKSEE